MTIAYWYCDPLLETPDAAPEWGEVVARVYCDWGDRSALAQFFQACAEAATERALVRRWSDLGDTPAAVEAAIRQVQSAGTELVACESEPLAGASEDARLWHAIARVEREFRCRQLRRGHARARRAAQPPPGKAPYGYRRGRDRYLLDRSTAPVVKAFAERFLLYGSLRDAVRYLERRFGKAIAVATGRRWLTHPVYRGDLRYGTGEVVPDAHAAILSRDEAAQIDRLLRRNRRLPPRAASARALSGLVVCRACQHPLHVASVRRSGRAEPYVYLRAPGCPRQPKCRALPYSAVLDRAIARIRADLPAAIAQLDRPDAGSAVAAIDAEIARTRALRERLPALERDGTLDAATAALRRATLNADLARWQSERDRLPPPNLPQIADTVSLPQFWYDLSEPERRFYLREFIQSIEILRLQPDAWEIQLAFVF